MRDGSIITGSTTASDGKVGLKTTAAFTFLESKASFPLILKLVFSSASGLRNSWKSFQHISWAGSSSFHSGRWSGNHITLSRSKMQQANRLRRLPHPRQVGDGAHRHHHEAQVRRRPVRRGVRRSLEKVQPHCSCKNTKGSCFCAYAPIQYFPPISLVLSHWTVYVALCATKWLVIILHPWISVFVVVLLVLLCILYSIFRPHLCCIALFQRRTPWRLRSFWRKLQSWRRSNIQFGTITGWVQLVDAS